MLLSVQKIPPFAHTIKRLQAAILR